MEHIGEEGHKVSLPPRLAQSLSAHLSCLGTSMPVPLTACCCSGKLLQNGLLGLKMGGVLRKTLPNLQKIYFHLDQVVHVRGDKDSVSCHFLALYIFFLSCVL